MDYDEFVTTVERMTGESREAAERATSATLGILAERIGADEARHLANRLEDSRLGALVFAAGAALAFDVEEFVRRVAERAQLDPAAAERLADAVFTVLARALGDDEYAHVLARLPRDFAPLLPKGSNVGTTSAGAFVADVARRAGVDAATARRLTEAVLETLAERIASGEVDDLISRLPIALHAALERGKAHGRGNATRMPVDEFVCRVAQRAQLGAEQVRQYAPAVFATLRETIREEMFDITVQLPNEYAVLGAKP
jgi:uncharacterized protein (DUF2267 family)